MHTHCTEGAQCRTYPASAAPPEVDDPDLLDDENDAMLQHGFTTAAQIRACTVTIPHAMAGI